MTWWDEYLSAWNRHDAEAVGVFFTEDGVRMWRPPFRVERFFWPRSARPTSCQPCVRQDFSMSKFQLMPNLSVSQPDVPQG